MIVAVLAYLGGVLTILSPCILPVLPFVFARTEQPFARSTLPLLVGMAATFAGISTLAAVGGSWAVHLNDYGRESLQALKQAVDRVWNAVDQGDLQDFTAMMRQGREYLAGRMRER